MGHVGGRQNHLSQVPVKRCSGKMDITIRRRTPTRDLDYLELICEHSERQFVETAVEKTARTGIEIRTQGINIFTDYWNEFRFTATEANYDDKGFQWLLLRQSNRIILDAWPRDKRPVVDVDDLAHWAIMQENKINIIKSLHETPITAQTDSIPQSPHGTYRTTNNYNQSYGDPMDLDATRKQPRLNISR